MNLIYYRELSRYEFWLKTHSPRYKLIDYEYKSNILKTNLRQQVNRISYNQYTNDLDDALDCITPNTFDRQAVSNWLDELFDNFGACAIKESIRLNNAYYHKLSRLKTRVGAIISSDSLFLTLTFKDSVLQSTSEKTRRRYVTRFLKKYSNFYVANIDFGSKRLREHYHAVIQCPKVSQKDWPYGNLDFEKVRINQMTSTELLSKYITKLAFHAIKETTKRQCLLYPKKKS